MAKKCLKCGIEKDDSDFYVIDRIFGTLQANCKKCICDLRKVKRKEEKIKAENEKDKHYKLIRGKYDNYLKNLTMKEKLECLNNKLKGHLYCEICGEILDKIYFIAYKDKRSSKISTKITCKGCRVSFKTELKRAYTNL